MPLTDLLRPTLRTMRWGGVAGAALPAAFVVWHFHNQPQPSPSSTAFGLRIAAVMLAVGLAFIFDDPTEETTGPAPVSVLARRALRVALALPPTLLFWLALRSYAGSGLPAWPFLLEAIAFGVVGLAGAAAGARMLADKLGGLVGAGAVLSAALCAAILPWAEGLLTRTPGTPPHEQSALWWWAMVAASVLVWWRMSGVEGLRFRRFWSGSGSDPSRPRPPNGRAGRAPRGTVGYGQGARRRFRRSVCTAHRPAGP